MITQCRLAAIQMGIDPEEFVLAALGSLNGSSGGGNNSGGGGNLPRDPWPSETGCSGCPTTASGNVTTGPVGDRPGKVIQDYSDPSDWAAAAGLKDYDSWKITSATPRGVQPPPETESPLMTCFSGSKVESQISWATEQITTSGGEGGVDVKGVGGKLSKSTSSSMQNAKQITVNCADYDIPAGQRIDFYQAYVQTDWTASGSRMSCLPGILPIPCGVAKGTKPMSDSGSTWVPIPSLREVTVPAGASQPVPR